MDDRNVPTGARGENGRAVHGKADTVHPADASRTPATGEIVVYARFHANGLVSTINHRPDHSSPQDWFDRLCLAVPETYQPLAGGRGAFRIRREAFDIIWRENATA